MLKRSLPAIFALLLGSTTAWARDDNSTAKEQTMEIGYVDVTSDITLRRMKVQSPSAKGTVLLLHGFPETLHAWKEISRELSADYEVHAFDWPGYGLSSRPTVDKFSYSPKDYARILGEYIKKADIDIAKLTIYATDIGALPALLLALENPRVAKTIIVGDFAPFNRPRYMYESLQSLKSEPSASATRAYMNKTSGEILENAFRRGLPIEAQFEVSTDFKDDMYRGWTHGAMTSADAFYHYYSNFTRDEDFLETNIHKLKTPVKVVWGEKDFYINKNMGIEFAKKINTDIILLPDIGHYPHLQSPKHAIEEIRASFR